MMRKAIPVILILALIVASFAFIVDLMVTKSAPAFVPAAWKQIPLGEKRRVVHEYLGDPFQEKHNVAQWKERVGEGKNYILDMRFDADSIAVYYRLHYVARLAGFSMVKTIREDSLVR